jgi:hypothetical protein
MGEGCVSKEIRRVFWSGYDALWASRRFLIICPLAGSLVMED